MPYVTALPRTSYINSYAPTHNRILGAGSFLWYPMHGSYSAGLSDLPDIVPVGSGHSGSPWASPGFYTFPVNNSTAGLGAPHGENNNLDATLSLEGAVADTTIVVAMEASFVDHIDAAGSLWFYGVATAASNIGLSLTVAEVPQMQYRAFGATAGTTAPMTPVSGKTFVDMKGQGRFAIVHEIRMTSAIACTTRVLIGKAGVGWTGSYTLDVADMLANGGTALPGRYTDVADHYGLSIGCRYSGSSVWVQHWGRGAGNTGRIGTITARKYTTYTTGLAEAVLAAMILRPLDVPEPFLGT